MTEWFVLEQGHGKDIKGPGAGRRRVVRVR